MTDCSGQRVEVGEKTPDRADMFTLKKRPERSIYGARGCPADFPRTLPSFLPVFVPCPTEIRPMTCWCPCFTPAVFGRVPDLFLMTEQGPGGHLQCRLPGGQLGRGSGRWRRAGRRQRLVGDFFFISHLGGPLRFRHISSHALEGGQILVSSMEKYLSWSAGKWKQTSRRVFNFSVVLRPL